MAGEVVVTELIIDASQSATGSAQYVAAMAKAEAAAEKQTVTMTQGVSRQSQQFVRLAAAANPVIAAQLALEKVTRTQTAALATGQLEQEQVNSTLAVYAARLEQARLASQQGAGATKLSAFQLQNLSYQMQDVGQAILTGQPIFRTLIQQGSQIVQTFGPGVGVAGALKAVGEGVVSFLLDPLNWAVLGIAAAAAGVALLWRTVSNSGDADKALERHKVLIDRIRDAWGEAGSAATEYSKDTREGLFYDIQAEAAQQAEQLRMRLKGFALLNDPTGALNPNTGADFGPLNKQVEEFNRLAMMGTADARGFSDELARIATSTDDQDVKNYAANLRSLLQPLVDLQLQAQQTSGALQLFAGRAAKGNFGASGSVADDLFRGWSEMDAKDALRSQLESLQKPTKQENDAARLQKQYDDSVKSIEKQTADLRIQADTFGMTESAAAAYRLEQQSLNIARENGIQLSPKELSYLHSVSAAYGDAALQLEKMKDAREAQTFLARSLFDSVKGANSLAEAFSNLAGKIADAALEAALLGSGPLAGLFGSKSSAGGLLGSLAGALLGGFGGGGIASGTALSQGGIGHNAAGNDNWPGGPTWVGEEGPEIVNLPRGAEIIPFRQSMAMASAAATPARIEVEVYVRDDGTLGAIARQAGQEAGASAANVRVQVFSQSELPDRMEQIKQKPRRRG